MPVLDHIKLVSKAAELARLQLTEDEVSKFSDQIHDVLGYLAKLGNVDVEGVEPLTHPWADQILETPLRPDRVIEPVLNADQEPKILETAAEVVDQGFKVPQVVG
ncbi:MAG: Asp-tRNA(Asn)/Glu-tRNA(Gln) amidotransferase subunit GatC [Bdellovibrionales bacterium]|nr:Asp-tRNA(Asn)/Glu-tRNA(Gln) amidotransferase subunit GatC [Bdellovibrionales bacterium]